MMKRIGIVLWGVLVAFGVAGCGERKETRIQLFLGTESPGFDAAEEGVTDHFMVSGPSKDRPYGQISVHTDGELAGTFRFGGAVCDLGSSDEAPETIEFGGRTSNLLYFGITETDVSTGKAVLLKKGVLKTGAVSVVLTRDPETLTYE